MKLSMIDSNKLSDDLINNIFFNIKKEHYDFADYLVIYGCHVKVLLDERLNHALDVIKSGVVKNIVLTGGVGVKGDFNEGEYMYNYLISNGIDESKIIVENKSTTTEENNINIMNMLNLQDIKDPINIVLVTQQVHMLRLIMHWNKILNNSNIKFYYDYVNNSSITYESAISDENIKAILKSQVDKMKKFIEDGVYEDIDIDINIHNNVR